MNLSEELLRIKQVMGILTEDVENEIEPIKVFPNGEGSENAEEFKGPIVKIRLDSTLPNEPFKDSEYMNRSLTVKKMNVKLKSGVDLPPIKVIEHPYDSTKYIVLDGHHRRFVYDQSNKKMIDAIVIPHKYVELVSTSWGQSPEESVKLIDVKNDKKLIDIFFTKPDNSNTFERQ
jgi:hypothetical protein